MTSALILALLFAQQATAPEKCSISGTVIDSVTGQPMASVEIIAEHLGNVVPRVSTTTDAAGKFLMADLDPGQYLVSAQLGGYQKRFYAARRSTNTGIAVMLTEGQKLEGMRFRLVPYGVISGTVRDTDGKVVVGAQVLLYSNSHELAQTPQIVQRAHTVTNDAGQYRIADLVPAKYYLSAAVIGTPNPAIDRSAKEKEPRATPLKTYYPGVLDPSAASPVEVSPGAGDTTADMNIIRGPAYQVTVHLDAPKGYSAGVTLHNSTPGFGNLGSPGLLLADANGNVFIAGVPAGIYNLRFLSYNHEGVTQGCSFDGESVPIAVVQADVTVSVIADGACPTIAGRLRIEGEHPPNLSEFSVNRAFAQSDGTFTLASSPGDHRTIRVRGNALDRDVYVKSITAGSQDVLHAGMTVNRSANANLEVVLAMDGGQVEGVAKDADGKPVPGATVVILPNDPTLRGSFNFTKDVIADLNGHFQIKAIAPGEYKLFAWEDAEQYSWFDPDFLKDYEARGQAVSVKAKDPVAATNPGQTVDLRVLR